MEIHSSLLVKMKRTDCEMPNTICYIYNTTSKAHHRKWSRRTECTKGVELFSWDIVFYIEHGPAPIISQQHGYLKGIGTMTTAVDITV